MEWLTTTISAVGLALIVYGLYLAWPPLACPGGGRGAGRGAWPRAGGDS